MAKQPPFRGGGNLGGYSRYNWGQRESEPQGYELPDSTALFALRILPEEVIATECGEDRFRAGKQIPDNRQDGVAHLDGGALVPTASAQAMELGGQAGIQAVGGGLCLRHGRDNVVSRGQDVASAARQLGRGTEAQQQGVSARAVETKRFMWYLLEVETWGKFLFRLHYTPILPGCQRPFQGHSILATNR
jgi:hypothetical protein